MKLQLTNGYILHFDQISRIIQYSLEQSDRSKIPRPEFLSVLGMSERQFENLSSICVALGLTKRGTFKLTALGNAIAQHDIFFDNIATLWIIHYVISSELKWVVWNRLINKVIPDNQKVNTDVALPYYADLSSMVSEKTIKEKLPKEILSSLNAYGEQKLSRLRIIDKLSTGEYIRSKPIEIEPLPFLFCLLHFRDIHSPTTTGLIIKEIVYSENSPGRVLFVAEYKINELLSKLHDMAIIRIETIGDLDQMRFSEGLTKDKVLEKMYGIES
jgi:hypothetical protein